MNEVSFQFLDKPIRCMDDGELKFVVLDLCSALTLSNASKSIKSVFPEYRRKVVIDGREFNAVTEPGLYQLIMRSRKAEAIQFQKYVFETVLPELREKQLFRIREENETTEFGKSMVRTIQGLT